MFLGLDPATSFGWAAWTPGMARPASGSFDLPDAEENLGRVGFAVHVELARLLTVHNFDRIYFEAPIGSQKRERTNLRTVEKALAISSHIESFAYAKNIRCRQVHMGTWRRFFVGKGAGEKGATFKAWARERCKQLQWNVRNSDEADACGVLAYAVSLDPDFIPPWFDELTFAPQFAPQPKRRRA